MSARPLRPPSAVLNLRVVEINGSAVRLAFTRPLEAVALSGYAISRLFAPDTPVRVTPHTNQTLQTTVALLSVTGLPASTSGAPPAQDTSAYVSGLQTGRTHYLAVQAVNPGGRGEAARIQVRPFPQASSPLGFEVLSLLALPVQKYK